MAQDRANVLTEVRAGILNEAFKGLLIVNGGGAIAIATLVQAVADTWPRTALRWAIWAIVPLLLAIAAALVSTILRYVNSLRPQSTSIPNLWWLAILLLNFSSVLLFLVGMGMVVRAGLLGFTC